MYHNHICWVIMPQIFAIMLNYAQVRRESYYAQIYAGIMCQASMSREAYSTSHLGSAGPATASATQLQLEAK